jgi:hypothetical protein
MDTPISEQAAFKHKPSYHARPSDWINSGGHAHSNAAQRFLTELSIYFTRVVKASDDPRLRRTWLLPFRDDFRRMLSHETSAAARGYAAWGDARLRHVFIWLLSHSADRFRLRGISNYCNDLSPQVRKHVAKALRRLEAWSLLDEMARSYPEDPRIQWFASARVTRRPFSERLSSFVRSVDDSHADEVVTPSRMPFWAAERSWDYTPPKSVLLIRRMLRRIRHWVRWGVG